MQPDDLPPVTAEKTEAAPGTPWGFWATTGLSVTIALVFLGAQLLVGVA